MINPIETEVSKEATPRLLLCAGGYCSIEFSIELLVAFLSLIWLLNTMLLDCTLLLLGTAPLVCVRSTAHTGLHSTAAAGLLVLGCAGLRTGLCCLNAPAGLLLWTAHRTALEYS